MRGGGSHSESSGDLAMGKIRREGIFNSPKVSGWIGWLDMESITKQTPPETSAVNDDDFDEPLGERQPEANDAIVCEGGCQ